MSFDTVWRDLRRASESIASDAALVTPTTERAFVVDATRDNRIVVRYRESDEERILWRDQFELLHDRLSSEAIVLDDLPPGVEPYVSVLSLLPRYEVDEEAGALRAGERGEAGGTVAEPESPFLRSRWEVRTGPERVHDDAVLLADLLDRHDVEDPSDVPPEPLTDVYVLLSEVQRGADDVRTDVGDELLQHIGPDGDLHGRFGTVHRTVRERRRLKDAETILDTLDEYGIPRDWALGVDREKLDVVVATTDLDETEVYDVEEEVYVQKTSTAEAEKREHLQGLKDRLEEVEAPEAEAIREDIEAIEDRLDALLASD